MVWDIAPVSGYTGTHAISLRDIIDNPEVSFSQIESNLRSNWAELLVASTVFAFSSKFARRALRGPINKANRLVFTGKNAPLRGMGLRI